MITPAIVRTYTIVVGSGLAAYVAFMLARHGFTWARLLIFLAYIAVGIAVPYTGVCIMSRFLE